MVGMSPAGERGVPYGRGGGPRFESGRSRPSGREVRHGRAGGPGRVIGRSRTGAGEVRFGRADPTFLRPDEKFFVTRWKCALKLDELINALRRQAGRRRPPAIRHGRVSRRQHAHKQPQRPWRRCDNRMQRLIRRQRTDRLLRRPASGGK